jgi:hypothetical protein
MRLAIEGWFFKQGARCCTSAPEWRRTSYTSRWVLRTTKGGSWTVQGEDCKNIVKISDTTTWTWLANWWCLKVDYFYPWSSSRWPLPHLWSQLHLCLACKIWLIVIHVHIG